VHENPDSANQYAFIVVYKDGIDPVATTAKFARRYSFRPRYVYKDALLGFAADLSSSALAGIRCEPEVRFIDPDRQVRPQMLFLRASAPVRL
jgi:hypothetical protein